MSKDREVYDDYFGEDEVKNIKDAESNDGWGVGDDSNVDNAETVQTDEQRRRDRGACNPTGQKWQNASSEGGKQCGWVVGFAFLAIGGLLLAGNIFGFGITNWWALFFLIPAAGSFSSAAYQYQEQGQLNEDVTGGLFGGFFMLLLMSIFLFGLSWNLFWPALLIMIGVKMLFRIRRTDSKTKQSF